MCVEAVNMISGFGIAWEPKTEGLDFVRSDESVKSTEADLIRLRDCGRICYGNCHDIDFKI